MRLVLLIIAMFFISGLSAQSIGQFRYDTTVFLKVGGNNEVKIQNGSRSEKGLFTNVGDGLGRWIKPRMNGDTLFIGVDTFLVAGSSSIKAANGLTLANDTVKLGGVLMDNTTIDMAGRELAFTNPGKVRIGATSGSTAQLQNNVPSSSTAIAMHGQFLSNSVAYTIHRIDTVTSSNVNSIYPRLAQWDRRLRFSDNNLTISDKEGFQMYLFYQGKDSVRIDPQNSDLAYVNKTAQAYGKFPGHTGRTIFQNGLFDFDAVSASLNETAINGTTSSSNYTRLRGYTSSATSYLIGNVNDTVDNYIGFLSTGKSGGNPRALKQYNFVSGKPTTTADSTWSLYALFNDSRMYHAGPVSFGAGTGPTEQLELGGNIKHYNLRSGDETDSMVVWNPSTQLYGKRPVPSGGALFGRTDVSNTTGAPLVFDNDGQNFQISNVGDSYIKSSGGLSGLYLGYKYGQLFGDTLGIAIGNDQITLEGLEKITDTVVSGEKYFPIVATEISSTHSISKLKVLTKWPTGSGGGGGSTALSAITAASATNTIDNNGYTQEWKWDGLGAASGLKLSAASTAAASNAQKVLEVATSGANATSTQTTYAIDVSNTHTGTASTNIGVQATTTGGSVNVPFSAVATEGNFTTHYRLRGNSLRGGAIGLGLADHIIIKNENLTNANAGVQIQNRASAQLALFSASGNAISNSVRYNTTQVSANYSVSAATDYIIEVTANSPTLTLPSATSQNGLTYKFVNTGAGTAVIQTTSSQVIGNSGSGTSINLAAGASLEITAINSAWRIF